MTDYVEFPDVELNEFGNEVVTYADLARKVNALERTIAAHDENLRQVMELLSALHESIAPTLATLSNGPVGKMLGL